MRAPERPAGWRRWARAAMVGLADLYLLGLFAWLLVWLVARDATPLLFAVNSFAVYLFLPLPLALIAGLAARHWPAVALSVGGAVVWAALWGRLFVPARGTPAAEALTGTPLRVLTTNLLGFNTQTDDIVRAIRAADADVVALQELSPLQASAIQSELSGEYPYQVLDPQSGVSGGGVISRYPLTPTGEELPGRWIGTPLVLRVDVNGQAVTFIRFHALSGTGPVRGREANAQALAEYATRHSGPLIVAGDFNATELSRAHQIVTSQLSDAWEARGWGLGHTFPGALSPGSSRPVIGGIPAPMWLIRIDTIFYAHGVTATSAAIGPWDGNSDHRPVVADLVIAPE